MERGRAGRPTTRAHAGSGGSCSSARAGPRGCPPARPGRGAGRAGPAGDAARSGAEPRRARGRAVGGECGGPAPLRMTPAGRGRGQGRRSRSRGAEPRAAQRSAAQPERGGARLGRRPGIRARAAAALYGMWLVTFLLLYSLHGGTCPRPPRASPLPPRLLDGAAAPAPAPAPRPRQSRASPDLDSPRCDVRQPALPERARG